MTLLRQCFVVWTQDVLNGQWPVLISVLLSFSVLQDLRKAGLLVFANKQDVKGCMSVAEISQSLQLTSVKDHQWHIQACCALTGEGWELPFCLIVVMLDCKSATFVFRYATKVFFVTIYLHLCPSLLVLPRLCQGLEWMMSRLRVRWWH